MQQLTRKSLGAMLASVGLATLIGVMGGGIVSADVVVQPDPDVVVQPDPNDVSAATTAGVAMKERCVWFVSGVPGTVTLEPTGGSVGQVYDGSKYSLAADLNSVTAYTSGSLNDAGNPDAHANCTFFGEQTGIELKGAWSTAAFTATATVNDAATPDENMNFSATSTDQLTFTIAKGTCRTEAWTVNESGITPSEAPASIMKLLAAAATPQPTDTALGNDKCDSVIGVTASIPANKTPLHAGKPYVFTGPTFTTEIEIDRNRG